MSAFAATAVQSSGAKQSSSIPVTSPPFTLASSHFERRRRYCNVESSPDPSLAACAAIHPIMPSALESLADRRRDGWPSNSRHRNFSVALKRHGAIAG